MAWYEIKARDIAGGTWEITVPALPGVITYAFSEAEIEGAATEAVEEAIENIIDFRGPVPEFELVKPDGRSVQIPDDVAATVVLYQLYYDEEGPGELDG
jgi:predicted RNase H-like HicB family nuclease